MFQPYVLIKMHWSSKQRWFQPPEPHPTLSPGCASEIANCKQILLYKSIKVTCMKIIFHYVYKDWGSHRIQVCTCSYKICYFWLSNHSWKNKYTYNVTEKTDGQVLPGFNFLTPLLLYENRSKHFHQNNSFFITPPPHRHPHPYLSSSQSLDSNFPTSTPTTHTMFFNFYPPHRI